MKGLFSLFAARNLYALSFAALMALPVQAQEIGGAGEVAVAAPSQSYCISMMAGFPADNHTARYQFFRLTQDMAVDANPQFRTALAHYADPQFSPDAPILDSIEAIANPVLRQAAPELIVAYMGAILDFSRRCAPYVSGQIDSLTAFDQNLTAGDSVIGEDALFLRQVLSDSLFRLNANSDLVYGKVVTDYANSLVIMRDTLEFNSFTSDIDDLEELYLTDLDGRLARSNDIINKEMDRETLGDAVALSADMDKAAKRKSDQDMVETLMRILNRY